MDLWETDLLWLDLFHSRTDTRDGTKEEGKDLRGPRSRCRPW